MINVGDKYSNVCNSVNVTGVIELDNDSSQPVRLIRLNPYCIILYAFDFTHMQTLLNNNGWKLIKDNMETKVSITHTPKGQIRDIKPKDIFTRETAHSTQEVIILGTTNTYSPLAILNLTTFNVIEKSKDGVNLFSEKTILNYLNSHGYKLFSGEIKITQ